MSGATRATTAMVVVGLFVWPQTAAANPVRAYEGPLSVASHSDATIELVTSSRDAGADEERSTTVPPPRVSTPPASPPPETSPLAEPRHDVRLRLGLDLAITLGAAAPTFALGLWVEPSLPDVVPMPGEEADVGRFDELALGRFDDNAAIASDVLLTSAIVLPLAYHAAEAALHRRGYSRIRGRGFFVRYGTDLVIMAQAIAINALLTQILKSAVRRSRPYTYLTPDEVDPDQVEDLLARQSETSADWSFPSGHTSTAFTATTAGATLLTLELVGRSNWSVALAWVSGLGISTTTGVLRVMSGRHFPSDVVTSALIGMGVGVAVPLAHWKPTPAGDRADFRDVMRSWAVRPLGSSDVIGLQLGGVLP